MRVPKRNSAVKRGEETNDTNTIQVNISAPPTTASTLKNLDLTCNIDDLGSQKHCYDRNESGYNIPVLSIMGSNFSLNIDPPLESTENEERKKRKNKKFLVILISLGLISLTIFLIIYATRENSSVEEIPVKETLIPTFSPTTSPTSLPTFSPTPAPTSLAEYLCKDVEFGCSSLVSSCLSPTSLIVCQSNGNGAVLTCRNCACLVDVFVVPDDIFDLCAATSCEEVSQ
eukprot:snap_masked-scaffold_86-processed-gene-0.18-mRNA-1 protein AED:1.00 eAED:1.00 QI:0/-1/0/0/-1/1/1/0/228